MESKNNSANSDIDEKIILTMQNENPKSVKELINSLNRQYGISKKQIMERILLLQNQGKIILKDIIEKKGTLVDYIFSIRSYWYLAILIISIITVTLVLVDLSRIPLLGIVFVYGRYLLGSLFVLFLPGYSFIRALFPEKEIDNIERFALSIGLSLALVALNALIFNYTPWGISTAPITLGLLGLTISMSTIAVTREYQILSTKLTY
jgi:hypothetical protein